MSRRNLVPAAEVTAVRNALRLKQSELAKRLGVTRRTVIRGEQRGLEIPYPFGDSPRKAVGEAWRSLKAEAAGALALEAKGAELAKRRRQNAEAARRYRARATKAGRRGNRKRRVTHRPRSRVTKPASRIRKSDKSARIRTKKSPRRAGRRRVRK